MDTVAVIDYGMGNLHSVSKALEQVSTHTQVIVTSDPQQILQAERVVFPGVGAIRDCMHEIKRLKLDATIKELIQSQRPLLAICVGMQALMDHSEENNGIECLHHFAGEVKSFNPVIKDKTLKIPHMGWNEVTQSIEHPLWQGIPNQSRFYFVHSYYVAPNASQQIAGLTLYGINFAAALAQDAVFAVQFHIEKSQAVGLRLLKNFLSWNGRL